ncbi:MAG: MaoC family dehydratase N-terminal domain-containing protein [Candidatus Binataceae bacterium]
MTGEDAYDAITIGETLTGATTNITRESIRQFAEASLDFNPLHLDDKFTQGDFGKTNFGGIIAHGMTTFALITRTLTDWLLPRGGIHRRLETRWLRPVRPGYSVTPRGSVAHKLETHKGRWAVFNVEVKNQDGATVATGEAMAEFPRSMSALAPAIGAGLNQRAGSGEEAARQVQALSAPLGFESNFFRNADRRKSWDEIIPGELRPTVPLLLTREAIQRFARAVGDLNPLYFDEQHAARSPYRGLVAPPSIHIMLMFACTPDDDWMRTPGTINAGQSWFYNVAARPGDTIRMAAQALDRFVKKDRLFVIHDNVFYNQKDEVVCSGRGWTIRPR